MKILFYRYTAIAAGCWTLTVCLLGLLISAAFPLSEADAAMSFRQVSWSQVSFQGSRFGSRLSITIDLEALPAAVEQSRFISLPKETELVPAGAVPFRARGDELLRLTVHTVLDPFGLDPVLMENHTWFDAQSGIPLHRDRLRLGEDEFLKTYHFTDAGVFRIQHQPKDKSEVRLPPEQWTRVIETFYPYDLKKLNCLELSEMSHLIWVAVAADIPATGPPMDVCAFGKRQLHRVRIIPGGLEEIPVDYREVHAGGTSTKENTTIQAVKMSIDAVPLPSSLDEPENFSVVGIREDIVVYVDPVTRVPLRISGGIPGFGHAALDLQQVRLR